MILKAENIINFSNLCHRSPMFGRNLFFLVSILATISAYPQSTDSVTGKSAKIELMSNWLTLKLAQSTDVETFAVLSDGQDIKLSPNASSVSRLSFNYRFISFAVSYVPKFLPGNNDTFNKGKTKSGGLSFSTNFRHWFNTFSYNRTKGYYLENTSDYDPSWTSEKPYVQFPDLKFTQYRFLSAYNSNPDFSMSAVTFQTERQIKSAGSFIPLIHGRYYINNDQSPILPGRSTQKANNLEITAGAGYHYTFVLKEVFYLSAGLTPGIGYIHSTINTRSQTESVKSRQNNFMFRVDGRVGAGYASRRAIAGFYTNFTESAYRQQKSSVITQNNRISFQLFVGYRLAAPPFLKKVVDYAEQQIPFSK